MAAAPTSAAIAVDSVSLSLASQTERPRPGTQVASRSGISGPARLSQPTVFRRKNDDEDARSSQPRPAAGHLGEEEDIEFGFGDVDV